MMVDRNKLTCGAADALLCDYLDGTLGADDRTGVEYHIATCAPCADLVADMKEAMSFMERAAIVEPPQELITKILFERPRAAKPAASGSWLGRTFGRWFEPILRPRFAMGMAMTILSFSMLGKFVAPVRQLRPADLDPVKIWSTLDDKAHRAWNSGVKYYENLRVVYEIQTRLREWSQEEDAERQRQAEQKNNPRPASGESKAAPAK